MSANPLQDNGLPQYDWLNRISRPIIWATVQGKLSLKTDGNLREWPSWLRKIIRREIVRVAKAQVGYIKWHTQSFGSETEYFQRLLRKRDKKISELERQLAEVTK